MKVTYIKYIFRYVDNKFILKHRIKLYLFDECPKDTIKRYYSNDYNNLIIRMITKIEMDE